MSQKYALKYSLRAREEINNNVRKNARFAHIMVNFGLVVREKRFSAHEAVLRIRDESIKKRHLGKTEVPCESGDRRSRTDDPLLAKQML